MSIENVQDFFGIKYFIPYSRTTYLPYGVFRVINEIAVERKVDFVDLVGGDAPGAWASEQGQPDNSISIGLREYPDFAFSLFEGATIDENTAEAAGTIGTPANKKGTSVYNATTGIASIAVKTAKITNLPAGRIVIKCTGAAKVKIYVQGLPQGDGLFQDVDGEVSTAELTIVSGSTTDVDALGITITGGSGTIGMTTDDTAIWDIRPVNTGNSIIPVGGSAVSTEFGAMCVFPKKSDGTIFYIDIHRINAFGVPWKASTRAWSEYTINGKILVDPSNSNYIYTYYKLLG